MTASPDTAVPAMPRWLPFEWIVAIRFLREGRAQTASVIGGVAIGVAVIVFMSALLAGLQSNIVRRVLTGQAHIVLLPPKETVRPQFGDTTLPGRAGVLEGAIVQAPLQRLKSLDQWQGVAAQIGALAEVKEVSPAVTGPALASDLGVGVGDKLRVTAANGASNILLVTGVFDLALPRGEFCAVMGPSGSGKSTLLNVIGLLDRPTRGTLSVCGEETTLLEDRALTRLRGHNIGFVFQIHHLLGAFTALENVMMPMLGDAGFPSAAMAQRSAALLDSVGLTQWRDQPSAQLSGGQQQRVALARALAMNPALLLADEPTGNLDTKSADAVFDLLRRVNREQGTSVLFVTHNPELARRCDKIIEVVDGQVVHQARPAG